MFHLSGQRKIFFSKLLICVAFIVTLIISFRVWLSERNYPLAPVFDFLPQINSPLDIILFGIMIALLIAIAAHPKPRIFIWILTAIFCFQITLDLNRLQTYFYMFLFMLISISVSNSENKKETLAVDCLRIILISVYFWSGVHKINIHFVDRIYYYVLSKIHVAPEFRLALKYVILIIPAIEVLLPLGLLVRSLRKISVLFLVLMHLGILIFLNPVVSGWNTIVIMPWNVLLVFLLIILFWNDEKISPKEMWMPKNSFIKTLVIILFSIMPAFNLIHLWDYYLSFNLYSMKVPYGAIYISPEIKNKLPDFIQPYILKNEKGDYIECTLWIVNELNVTPYPNMRAYEKTKNYICSFSEKKNCDARVAFYLRYEDLLADP